MKFDHVGMTTFTKHEEAVFVSETKVWITDPTKHEFKIEWLRYEEDSTVSEKIKGTPHVGYIVDSIDDYSENLTCLLGPFDVGDNRRVAFFELEDGAIIELIEVKE